MRFIIHKARPYAALEKKYFQLAYGGMDNLD